jgi:hypothetical protein
MDATAHAHPIRMQPLVEGVLTRLQPVIAAYEAEVVLPRAWPWARGHETLIAQRWTEDIRTAIVHSGRQSRVELASSLMPGGKIRFWVRTKRCALSFTLPAALRADQLADD